MESTTAPGRLLPVPLVQQLPGRCGPASLRAVCAYFGTAVSEDRVAALAGTTADGTTPEGLCRAAGALGYAAKVFEMEGLDAIARCVAAGVPPIVDWWHEGDGHYSVAVGIDTTTIYLMDPEIARVRRLSLATFAPAWHDWDEDGAFRAERLIVVRPKVAGSA